MRKDIEIHIQTADVAIAPQNSFKLRNFRWIEDVNEDSAELNRYVYGEIEVPYTLSENTIRKNGLYFTIPYTPIYKEFKIRIRRVNGDMPDIYVVNETNGSNWFTVKASKFGQGSENVFVSTLPSISESSFFINLINGVAQIYSCDQSDFNIIKADRQNANCLLACVPGCNYRYPLTGVGLIRWINSTNIMSTNLSQILQDEFAADGVKVKEAVYNYDSNNMDLSLEVQEDQ